MRQRSYPLESLTSQGESSADSGGKKNDRNGGKNHLAKRGSAYHADRFKKNEETALSPGRLTGCNSPHRKRNGKKKSEQSFDSERCISLAGLRVFSGPRKAALVSSGKKGRTESESTAPGTDWAET